ncbi:hypothetical protein V6N13_038283 [Hibiscus sabdariffa]
MLIFVFAGRKSGMTYAKITNNGAGTPAGLVATSLSHDFALFVAVSLLGSIVACLLLKFSTGGMETSAFALSLGVSAWNIVVFEIVMMFGLVASIVAGGSFDGASMKPAVSYGPAVVSWTWTNHWVFWLGPFTGAAIAAIVYEF